MLLPIAGKPRATDPGLSCSCGPKGIRTPDLLDANEARYQLRHRPVNDIYVITLAIPDMTKAPHLHVSRGVGAFVVAVTVGFEPIYAEA